MKKALMYLLLAFGIILGVLFVGGAVMGFVAGFIDGFQGNETGTTSVLNMMTVGGCCMILVLALVLNWVFLRLGCASYSVGRIPQNVRWKVILALAMAMAGLAVLYCIVYNPIIEPDGTIITEQDSTTRKTFLWMKTHPLVSIPMIIVIEATANLVIYGAVLREILEWKHRPAIVITVYAVIMVLVSKLYSSPLLILPTFMMAMLEGWVYEYSRSVIPVIIGDVVFWLVLLFLLGTVLSGAWFVLVALLVIPGACITLRLMEPYKPID